MSKLLIIGASVLQLPAIKKAKEFENQIIEQCKKYNMKYIDTSYNRESIFNELLNEIKENI